MTALIYAISCDAAPPRALVTHRTTVHAVSRAPGGPGRAGTVRAAAALHGSRAGRAHRPHTPRSVKASGQQRVVCAFEWHHFRHSIAEHSIAAGTPQCGCQSMQVHLSRRLGPRRVQSPIRLAHSSGGGSSPSATAAAFFACCASRIAIAPLEGTKTTVDHRL